ncbi:hypothetical protein GQS40_01795|uniref:Tetratricopeptide repeat protein n=1 Tax=Leuconostoc lactis TaxID=1246 RepID=A0A6L7A5T0_LEULA|nr:hypothetical protein [Leuconostoc lactis]
MLPDEIVELGLSLGNTSIHKAKTILAPNEGVITKLDVYYGFIQNSQQSFYFKVSSVNYPSPLVGDHVESIDNIDITSSTVLSSILSDLLYALDYEPSKTLFARELKKHYPILQRNTSNYLNKLRSLVEQNKYIARVLMYLGEYNESKTILEQINVRDTTKFQNQYYSKFAELYRRMSRNYEQRDLQQKYSLLEQAVDKINNNLMEAIDSYRIAIENANGSLQKASVWYLYSIFYTLKVNDDIKAKECIEQADELAPNTPEIQLENDPFNPKSLLDNLQDENTKIASIYLLQALEMSAIKKWEVADNLLNKAADVAPNYFEVYKIKAFINADIILNINKLSATSMVRANKQGNYIINNMARDYLKVYRAPDEDFIKQIPGKRRYLNQTLQQLKIKTEAVTSIYYGADQNEILSHRNDLVEFAMSNIIEKLTSNQIKILWLLLIEGKTLSYGEIDYYLSDQDTQELITSRSGLGELEYRYVLKEMNTDDARSLFTSLSIYYQLELHKQDNAQIDNLIKTKLYSSPLSIKW